VSLVEQPEGLPPPGPSRLITRQNTPLVLTLRQETDARTAMTRGMREYLEQLSMPWTNGTELQFRSVHETWASPEDDAQFPSASVYALEPLSYGLGDDASPFTPQLRQVPGTSATVLCPTFGELRMLVEGWGQNSEQRMLVAAALEAALHPVEWMNGFWLDLPHYFGQRAKFSAETSNYGDDEENAHRGYRKVAFLVTGQIEVTYPYGPALSNRTRVAISIDGVSARGVHNDGSTGSP
jgi:hypothetical protein